jgi:hypothetical protein
MSRWLRLPRQHTQNQLQTDARLVRNPGNIVPVTTSYSDAHRKGSDVLFEEVIEKTQSWTSVSALLKVYKVLLSLRKILFFNYQIYRV